MVSDSHSISARIRLRFGRLMGVLESHRGARANRLSSHIGPDPFSALKNSTDSQRIPKSLPSRPGVVWRGLACGGALRGVGRLCALLGEFGSTQRVRQERVAHEVRSVARCGVDWRPRVVRRPLRVRAPFLCLATRARILACVCVCLPLSRFLARHTSSRSNSRERLGSVLGPTRQRTRFVRFWYISERKT